MSLQNTAVFTWISEREELYEILAFNGLFPLKNKVIHRLRTEILGSKNLLKTAVFQISWGKKRQREHNITQDCLVLTKDYLPNRNTNSVLYDVRFITSGTCLCRVSKSFDVFVPLKITMGWVNTWARSSCGEITFNRKGQRRSAKLDWSFDHDKSWIEALRDRVTLTFSYK